MDNAMVKRGIGAVVLAIIAALLLGYLLKDKSRERQEVVEMKLPGAPEIKIPSLSEVSEKVSDTTATIVEETKETMSDAGNAVVATASAVGSTASNTVDAVKNSASSASAKVAETVTNTNTTDPGFSFRPPTKNEEQEINTSTAINAESKTVATNSTEAKNNDVVASAPKAKVEKKFTPTIENEPKKVVKKKPAPKKKEVAKASKPKTAPAKSSSGGKYSIQLLATSSQSRANKLAKTMTSEGYVSYITQTTSSNNKVLYRVRVGGHNNRKTALDAQASMKRRYQKNFFVQNSLVVSK